MPAHGSAAATIRLGAGAEPGSSVMPITVTGDSLHQRVTLAQTDLLATVPYIKVGDAFTDVGVTSDADIAPPNPTTSSPTGRASPCAARAT